MGTTHNFYHRACDVAAGEDIEGITVAEDGRVALEYGEFPENLRCNWAGFLYDLSLTPAAGPTGRLGPSAGGIRARGRLGRHRAA